MIREDLANSLVAREAQLRFAEQASSMLDNLRSRLDPMMDGWMPSSQGADFNSANDIKDDVKTLRMESRRAYYKNPHGKGVIRTLIKFIIGSGVMLDFEEKSPDGLKALNDHWRKVRKHIKWTKFIREYGRRLFRDGETIVRRFDVGATADDDALPSVRFIEPDSLDDDDIVFAEGDPTTPVEFKFSTGAGKPKDTVPAEKVHFIKADVDDNVPRGRPILEPILPYLTKYGKWLDARMVLNIVRASVTIVQEVQGSNTNLLNLAAQNRSTKTAQTDKTKMIRPGSIIRGTPGVKYQMLSPNLDARDASEDGRTILLAVAVAAGFPDVFVTADYGKANFASTVVAQNPAIREFEDWQQFIGEGLAEVINWFLEDALERGILPAMVKQEDGKPTPLNIDFTLGFPPLLRRDVGQENMAYSDMHANRVISKRSWGTRMGFNRDQERRLIEEEDKEAPGPQPPQQQPGGTKPIPKRVQDRQPRQNQATGSEAVEE